MACRGGQGRSDAMFTGLVEEVGVIEAAEPEGDGRRLVVHAALVARDLGPGDSVSVNGCCQTVVSATDGQFSVIAVPSPCPSGP